MAYGKPIWMVNYKLVCWYTIKWTWMWFWRIILLVTLVGLVLSMLGGAPGNTHSDSDES